MDKGKIMRFVFGDLKLRTLYFVLKVGVLKRVTLPHQN